MPFKQVNGWWCPRCQCLMMAKNRKADKAPVPCDCIDVQIRGGNGPEWLDDMKKRIRTLVGRQKEWKRLYIKE